MVRAKKRDLTLARLSWASAAVGFAVAPLWVMVLAPVVQPFSLALAGSSGELLIPFSLCVFFLGVPETLWLVVSGSLRSFSLKATSAGTRPI